MQISLEDFSQIQEEFGIRNGAWTKVAINYFGLSYPLAAGWKERLLAAGSLIDSPHHHGLSVADWLFLNGDTPDDPLDRRVTQDDEIKMRLDALEIVVSDMRAKLDKIKSEIRAIKDLRSGEEW